MIDTKNKIVNSENVYLREHSEIITDGWTIRNTNLMEKTGHTLKFKGVKNLTIEICNVRNCDFPDGTVIKNCFHHGLHSDIVEQTEEEKEQEDIIEKLDYLANKYGVEKVNPVLKERWELEAIPKKVDL